MKIGHCIIFIKRKMLYTTTFYGLWLLLLLFFFSLDKWILLNILFYFICSVTVPGYQGNLQAAIAHTSTLASWERFGVEMTLTFIVVLAYFMSTDSYKSYFGVSSLSVGAAYSACSFVSVSILIHIFFFLLLVSLLLFNFL